jgi:uncharacterized membrane protein
MATHPIWVLRWMPDDDLRAVSEAIARVERRTSAEIRVHLERHCPGEPASHAGVVFAQLGMHQTRDRNAVLVYVAIEDRRLAVFGDQGIHERVAQPYWEALAGGLASRLAQGPPREALEAIIAELGRCLEQHFPRQPDDRDELPDRVSAGP